MRFFAKSEKLFGLAELLGAVALREQWNYDGDCRSTGFRRLLHTGLSPVASATVTWRVWRCCLTPVRALRVYPSAAGPSRSKTEDFSYIASQSALALW